MRTANPLQHRRLQGGRFVIISMFQHPQRIAHDVACICVAPAAHLLMHQLFQLFGQCHLHENNLAILPLIWKIFCPSVITIADSLKKKMARALVLRYCRPMTAEDVKALPVDTKIQIMEAIWEDLRNRFDRMEISQEQKDILDRRRARVRDGEAQLLDWESVKGSVGRP